MVIGKRFEHPSYMTHVEVLQFTNYDKHVDRSCITVNYAQPSTDTYRQIYVQFLEDKTNREL